MTAEALTRFAETDRFEVALDAEGPPPDDPLLRLYGGPLRVRLGTPRLVANFVVTADGVTAFGEGGGEGAMAVSLHSPADRFLMALLRSAADCVLIGAGTLRDDPHHQWTPSTPMPDLAEELTAHRRRLTGADGPPPLAVVTGSGDLPAAHPALRHPEGDVLVITTEDGAAQLPRCTLGLRSRSRAGRVRSPPARWSRRCAPTWRPSPSSARAAPSSSGSSSPAGGWTSSS